LFKEICSHDPDGCCKKVKRSIMEKMTSSPRPSSPSRSSQFQDLFVQVTSHP
jgi:hypothetical protein